MEPIVLASGSASRRAMLAAAGITFTVDRPEIDEGAVKLRGRSRGLTVEATAAALALAKAMAVAPRWPGALVLAADQMLECDGEWFDKPAGPTAAARQLSRLSGKTHRLISSAVVVRDGVALWDATTMADLTMRELSEAFIGDYLAAAGDGVLGSVGAYQIEGLGAQLFDAIRGDHFTILGLPLLPLLAFLRAAGVLPS
jgi:septum formation protein